MKILARLVLSLGLGCAISHAADAAEVVIGIAAPLSGPDAIFGNQIRLGVEQAVADIDAAGGFVRLRGRAVARDDRSDPARATDVARSFAAEKVSVVIGDFSSAATVAASTVYADAGIPQITPSALAPLVTDRDLMTIFRTCGRDDEQAEVAARFLQSRHIARVAIVHDRTSTGKQLADSLRKVLGGLGIKDPFYGSLEKGTRDVSGLVGRIKASGSQIVFYGGSASDAGLLARQLHDANVHATMMGSASLASEEFASAAGGGADGTLLVFPQDPKTRPAAADLLRTFRGKGVEPGAYVFYAYAAVQIVQQAMAASGFTDPMHTAATMHDGKVFRTVLGDISFNQKGDPTTSDFMIYVWHKGSGGRMTFDDQPKT